MRLKIKVLISLLVVIPLLSVSGAGRKDDSGKGDSYMHSFESDTFMIQNNELKIYFISHGTLVLSYAGKIIHIDPVSGGADYAKLPAADLILITHQHGDHLDPAAIAKIKKQDTLIIADSESAKNLEGSQVMKNGDKRTSFGIEIEAVPAYNTTPGRENFHPMGRDNGYILNFAGFKVYIAGDTENIPEMKQLKGINVAFLPMNQPYTMLPAQAAEAAKSFQPAVLYPYHYGETDPDLLTELLKEEKNTEVRIRKLK